MISVVFGGDYKETKFTDDLIPSLGLFKHYAKVL